jgi:hypothetical protein
MSKNLYKDFDDIFVIKDEMLEYAEKNIKLLQKNVSENLHVKKYGINSMYGGYFCPSLILEKIVGGFKKGKLFNNIPKGRNIYNIYELDKNNQLLREQEITSERIGVEHYIINNGNTKYFMAISGKEKCTYVYSLRAIYEDEKIKQFDIIDSNSLRSEQYEYGKDMITCKQYYYVPGLKGSNKSVPIGEEGSPMKLYIINFKTDEDNKIYWLEHGEYRDGNLEIGYEYSK